MFSGYHSDGSGLAVFDFKSGKMVFRSTKLPSPVDTWYHLAGKYFFRPTDWSNRPGFHPEKPRSVYEYDFVRHRILARTIPADTFRNAAEVKYDFHPNDYKDCDCDGNPR
jgi:hypothetical protein